MSITTNSKSSLLESHTLTKPGNVLFFGSNVVSIKLLSDFLLLKVKYTITYFCEKHNNVNHI